VDVSLLDSVTALLTYQAARQFATGETPVRTGNRHMTIAPYDTFDTADGVLVLAVGNDAQWRKLCAVLGAPDLVADTRFASNAGRVSEYDALRPKLQAYFGQWQLATLVDRLKAEGVPCGAVRSITDVTGDPQVLARRMVETVMHPAAGAQRVLGIPVKLSDTPGEIRSAPPLLGEHTVGVLTHDLGLSDGEVDALARAGVIRRQP
jgi:CoA:oxalate CoA-transferase